MWLQVNQQSTWPRLININHMVEITIEAEETTADLYHIVFQSIIKSRELVFKVKLYSGDLTQCTMIISRLIAHILHGKPLFMVTE